MVAGAFQAFTSNCKLWFAVQVAEHSAIQRAFVLPRQTHVGHHQRTIGFLSSSFRCLIDAVFADGKIIDALVISQ